MKFLLMIAIAGLAAGQSNPSWWKYAPPEATAIVGIQWKSLQGTALAPMLSANMAPGGSFGFPDIEMARTAEQIVVGSPSFLVLEYGSFPLMKLRAQAEAGNLKRLPFKTAELFVSADPAVLSIAYIHEKLILLGSRKTLEDAVTRITNPKERAYSPLLARGARYSKEDLWVVAARLPDPLASQFLPLEVEATAFEGSVSIWDGLHMVAAIERSTPMKALDFADSLAESLANRPAMAEGTEITTRDRSVLIRMDLDEEELASSLRVPLAEPKPTHDPHTLISQVAPPARTETQAFVPPPPPRAKVASPEAAFTMALPEPVVIAPPILQSSTAAALPPAPPRKIRIIGLEGGPKEIPLGQ